MGVAGGVGTGAGVGLATCSHGYAGAGDGNGIRVCTAEADGNGICAISSPRTLEAKGMRQRGQAVGVFVGESGIPQDWHFIVASLIPFPNKADRFHF